MHESHFAGLRAYADDAVRQPDFAVVRQRAGRVRRRRVLTSSVAAVVATLTVTALGYAAAGGSGEGPPLVAPTTPGAPEAGWPRLINVVATGPGTLYAVYERCRTCDQELYASDDAGGTWQRRTVPPVPPVPQGLPPGLARFSTVVPLGKGILAWTDARLVTVQDMFTSPSATAPSAPQSWITVDGGRTWRRTEVAAEPVAAVPRGTRPVDCSVVGQLSPCRVYAVDPVGGRFAPLAEQPSGITFEAGWTQQTNVPIEGRLWVAGLDPATRKPAVASSPDGGRTWHTHVFTGGVAAVADQGMIATMYLPAVAADADGTAYAMTYRDDHALEPYRTTDGGATWRPVSGGTVADVPDAGFVTADGAHIVKSGQEFRASRDGGGYGRVTLPGYPADLLRLTQVTWAGATGRYLVFSLSQLYLSDDGWTWRQANGP
jgi:hypothetical protein